MSNIYGDGGEFGRRRTSTPAERWVKFLCSHGGKILPRPSDGHLKYVGGETRVISVPRDISFQELMKRLTYSIDGEMILKYQLATEDLDALVTVKSNKDLAHMFDEMEHLQMMGFPRTRTFLFPAKNFVSNEQLPLNHRYIFSINGILSPARQHPNPSKPLVASSTCTSPRSPDSRAPDSDPWPHHTNNNHQKMPRIRSSPSICNLVSMAPKQQQPQNNQYSQHQHPHHPQYYNSSMTTTHNSSPSYRSPRTPVRVGGRGDGARFLPDSTSPPPPYCYPSRDHNIGCSTINMQHNNCGHFFSDPRLVDRPGASIPN